MNEQRVIEQHDPRISPHQVLRPRLGELEAKTRLLRKAADFLGEARLHPQNAGAYEKISKTVMEYLDEVQ